MRKILAAMAVASVSLASGPALADLACGSLLMPVAQLKQVSRGISAHHAGLDLVAPHGSPLRAAAGGRVVFAGTYYAYGLMVDVEHAPGLVTRYAHLSAFAPGIRPGAEVSAGALLGKVGRTGRTTTAHLHLEVRVNGRPVDPKPYLALAPCTPRTPSLRVIEARAAQPGPAEVVASAAQGAALDLSRFINPARPAVARPIDGRPGGLLE